MYIDNTPRYKKLFSKMFGWIGPEVIVSTVLVTLFASLMIGVIAHSNHISSFEGVTIEWQGKSCYVANFDNGDPVMVYLDEEGNFIRFKLEFEEFERLAEEQGVRHE
jgi:hypothetical protein